MNLHEPFGNFLGSASLPEILWMLAAIDLFRVSWFNHHEALIDRTALGDIQNGRRRLVDMNLFVARVFMAIAWLKFSIGILAVLTPTRNPPTPAAMLVLSVLVVSLIAADVAMRSMRNFRLYINEYGMQPRDEKGRFKSDRED